MTGAELPLLGADFEIIETDVDVSNAPAQLCAQNSHRWALIIGNVTTSGGSVNPTTLPGRTASGGISTTTGTAPFMLNFRDHGALVQLAWYTFPANPSKVTVIEVLYKPRG